jgi:hypothetical protein
VSFDRTPLDSLGDRAFPRDSPETRLLRPA